MGRRAGVIRFLARLRDDRRGVVAVILALTLPIVIGMVSLGVETGLWFAARRAMQTAADAGALSGAREIMDGLTDYKAAAVYDAQRNGYSTASGATVTVYNPPISGAYTGDSNAVEVDISQPQGLLFSRLFLGSLTVHARAVATQAQGNGQYCVLGLDTSAPDTVYLNNNATLPNANCGAASRSTDPNGLVVDNNAHISGAVGVGGSSYYMGNNGEIDSPVTTHAVFDDPYAAVTTPTLPSCTGQTSSGKNNVTINLTPGNFCSGLNFSNNATVNMAPGTYYVQNQFSFQNNAVLNATSGVTIVVVGNYAIDVGNNAVMNITAPTSGNYQGLAFCGDRNGDSSVTQVFSNNAVLNITGAVYFPNQAVEMDNNGTSNANGCVQVIGRRVIFNNNANLPNNCSGSGTRPITNMSLALVE
ncbi:MAG: pilus assembly protein [Magnetospirillum sp.]|nr:pilus assembly protein [Magnetospirillum sp.]